uniref:Uncharacterized protein n=1 Tax=Oryza meridionalis TaxID=40149 RepID=A0A0E0DWI3_9ORYZ
MLALNTACEEPFRKALRWVVRRGGGQAGGWSEVACAVIDRQWNARHAPLHAQLLAPPLPGTGAINEIHEGVGKHSSVNVPLDAGCWAAKASSSQAPCTGMPPCVVAVGGEPR